MVGSLAPGGRGAWRDAVLVENECKGCKFSQQLPPPFIYKGSIDFYSMSSSYIHCILPLLSLFSLLINMSAVVAVNFHSFTPLRSYLASP